MLDQLVEGVREELVTEPSDVGGPFQPYVPGNGHGSLPNAVGTNVFTFLAMVCEAASLEPTGFIPGSPISDSHVNLRNSPKHQDGDNTSKVSRSAITGTVLLHREKLSNIAHQ